MNISTMEKTLIMIKPDGIEKRLVGEIVKRLENLELKIDLIKAKRLSEKEICILYKDSLNKFPQIKKSMIRYMNSGDVIIIVLSGENAIKKARTVRGDSNPATSPLGSIRRDFAANEDMDILTQQGKATKNLMHASGTLEEFKFEFRLLFDGEN